MKEITLTLSDAQYNRLVALAAAKTGASTARKKYTVATCIAEFADTCQPGGSGWVIPGSAAHMASAVVDKS